MQTKVEILVVLTLTELEATKLSAELVRQNVVTDPGPLRVLHDQLMAVLNGAEKVSS